MKKTIFLLAFFSFAPTLVMASSIHKIKTDSDRQDITIPLSTTPLEVISKNEDVQKEREVRREYSMEMGVNSWSPKNLNVGSLVPVSSSFNQSVPELSIKVITAFSSTLKLKGGFDFTQFNRTGTLNSAGESTTDTQTAYVPAFEIGVEYLPQIIHVSWINPYLGASLKPTLLFTNRTTLSQGETDFGVPVVASAGFLFSVSKTWALDVGVSETLGKVSDSDFSGFGVGAGVRASL